MKSIQRQLSWGLIISLVGIGLLLLQTSLWLFESNVRHNLETQLSDEALGLLVALDKQTGQLDISAVNPKYQRAFSGYYFRISLAGGATWRSRSLWDFTPEWPEALGNSKTLVHGPSNQRLLTHRSHYQRGGQHIYIDIAQNYGPVLTNLGQVRFCGFGLMAAALVVLLILQRWIIRQALHPLEEARHQLIHLQQGHCTQLAVDCPAELQPLVAQINHLLEQMEISLRRSRNATGNLGHALKTPLTILNSLSQRPELNTYPELQSGLQEHVQQVEVQISRALNRARLATDVLPGQHFNCDHELPELFSTLNLLHPRGLKLEWQAPPGLRLPWDREDMLELLGNLLDNACKWAYQQVSLQIVLKPEHYLIIVDDDGPGIAPEHRLQVMNRGTRLDERQSGHGLGLDIVRDIIDAWQGSWQLKQSPLGGLQVQLKLPHWKRSTSAPAQST